MDRWLPSCSAIGYFTNAKFLTGSGGRDCSILCYVTEGTVASLFSGCGGFDLGFRQEGFKSVGGFDISRNAVETFNLNVASVARVADLSVECPAIKADVLLAGSPCQGFSTSGKRVLDDPRNDLLKRAGQIALAVKPKVFILENVPAAISGAHGSRWNEVEQMLQASRYNVRRIVAEGATSGVPQLRKRLFLVAWKGSEHIDCTPNNRMSEDLGAALAGVDDLQGQDVVPLLPGSKEFLIATHIRPGQKLSNVRDSPAAVPTWEIPEVFGKTSASEREVLVAVRRLRRRQRRRSFGDADPVLLSRISEELGRGCEADAKRLLGRGYLRSVGRYVDLRHTYNGKYRRLSLSNLSPTVDTHFGNPSLFLHPSANRGLTPRESARIQGFPDWFLLPESRSQAFQMIGNAVPPPMAAKLAKFVREAILPVAK